MRIILFVVLCFISIVNNAYAVECMVDYRAERKVPERAWIISIDKLEVSSGTVNGEGEDLKTCKEDAINKLRKNGWKITYVGDAKEI